MWGGGIAEICSGRPASSTRCRPSAWAPSQSPHLKRDMACVARMVRRLHPEDTSPGYISGHTPKVWGALGRCEVYWPGCEEIAMHHDCCSPPSPGQVDRGDIQCQACALAAQESMH